MYILNLYRKVRHYYKTIIAEKENKSVGGTGVRIPFSKRLKYNLLGFTAKEIVYYDLLHNDYHNYISHDERLKLEDINGRFAPILGEKVMLEKIWGNYLHVPKTYAYIQEEHFFDTEDNVNEVDIILLLKNYKQLIAKPTRSTGGGHGICSLKELNGAYYINEVSYNEQEFINKLKTMKGYIITQWIYPHEYAKKVFPQTTNTMRIVTIMNHHTHKAEVLTAIHRFGTIKSIPVDNACSGGIRAFVDLEKGQLEEARSMLDIKAIYERHPDSGETIKGLTIPYWNRIQKELVHAHNCFPYYEFLAWDAVLAEDDNLYILEINRGMDLHWLQISEPLRHSPIGNYMREKGLLRKW